MLILHNLILHGNPLLSGIIELPLSKHNHPHADHTRDLTGGALSVSKRFNVALAHRISANGIGLDQSRFRANLSGLNLAIRKARSL